MKIYPDIHSFIGGLLTPKLEGRVDYAKYGVGCRILNNFIVTPTGGIYKRPGTKFVARAKTNNVRLVPFDFNSTESQSYVLEIGQGYIRFFTREGQAINAGGTPLEITIPALSGIDLSLLRYVQSADVVYFAHPQMQPWRLERYSALQWAYQPLVFLQDEPRFQWYRPVTTMLSEEFTNSILMLDGSYIVVAKINRDYQNEVESVEQYTVPNSGYYIYMWTRVNSFASNYPGKIRRQQADGTVPAVADDPKNITAIKTGDVVANIPILSYGEQLPFGPGNYPSKVMIYEDRLTYAATPQQPLNLWMSKLADYSDFRLNTNLQNSDYTMEPLPEDSIWLRITGSRVNPIMWLLDMEQLLVGTNAAELRIQGRDIDTALTPATAGYKRQSSYGSNTVPAVMLGSSAMFCSRTGRELYTLDYQDLGYRFKAAPLNLLASEVLEPGVAELHSMQEPEPIAWCILSDGSLAGCTYIKDQQIFAWHKHYTQGKVKSGAMIPGSGGEQFWIAVERNGQTFIEFLQKPFDFTADNAVDTVFMDAMLTGTASKTGSITGLAHLVGQLVQVVSNGSYLGFRQVDATGTVYEDKIRAGHKVAIGLGYTAEMQPMRPNYAVPRGGNASNVGQAVHFKKRIVDVILRVLGSIKGEVRAEYSQPVGRIEAGEYGEWQELIAFPYKAFGGEPPPCRTETVTVPLSGNSSKDGLVRVRQADPFPMFITAVAYGIDQPTGG